MKIVNELVSYSSLITTRIFYYKNVVCVLKRYKNVYLTAFAILVHYDLLSFSCITLERFDERRSADKRCCALAFDRCER